MVYGVGSITIGKNKINVRVTIFHVSNVQKGTFVKVTGVIVSQPGTFNTFLLF